MRASVGSSDGTLLERSRLASALIGVGASGDVDGTVRMDEPSGHTGGRKDAAKVRLHAPGHEVTSVAVGREVRRGDDRR